MFIIYHESTKSLGFTASTKVVTKVVWVKKVCIASKEATILIKLYTPAMSPSLTNPSPGLANPL